MSEGNSFALSPICKHLGCTIGWNTEKNDQYVCPCHGAHYTKDGKNLVVAPKPLDEYDLKLTMAWFISDRLMPIQEYKRRRRSDV